MEHKEKQTWALSLLKEQSAHWEFLIFWLKGREEAIFIHSQAARAAQSTQIQLCSAFPSFQNQSTISPNTCHRWGLALKIFWEKWNYIKKGGWGEGLQKRNFSVCEGSWHFIKLEIEQKKKKVIHHSDSVHSNSKNLPTERLTEMPELSYKEVHWSIACDESKWDTPKYLEQRTGKLHGIYTVEYYAATKTASKFSLGWCGKLTMIR